MTDDSSPAATSGLDSSVPHSARIWNYWLGGKDNYEADRVAGDQFCAIFPGIVDIAQAGRAFLRRAVRYLAGEAGVRQFLDVGTGLPTMENTHQIAQQVAPQARIAYVDNDPLVLTHARALLTSAPEGVTDYIHADLYDAEAIAQQAAQILDLDRPVALMLMGILGHVPGNDTAKSVVRGLMDILPSGSFLAIYDSPDSSQDLVEALSGYNDTGAIPYYARPLDQIIALFDGLEMVPPGVVPCPQWRPDTDTVSAPAAVEGVVGGVGRKP